MKAPGNILWVFFVLILLSSCTGIGCIKSKGTLKLTNTSTSTVQKLLVDGISYGTIDPGESKKIELPTGSHSFQFQGISGGSGCSSGSVIIQACETSAYTCSS